MRKIYLIIIGSVFSLFLDSARAEYQSPFHCMPPMGQQMFEIAAMNMTRAYRENPSAATKAKACNAHKKVVKVYKDAVKVCETDNCNEAQFLETCARKSEKLAQWKENSSIVCGAK